MFKYNKIIFKIFIVMIFSAGFIIFQNCAPSGSTSYSSSSKNRNYSNDTSGPDITIFSKPSAISNQRTAQFQVIISDDKSGADYGEYQHNDGGWVRMHNLVKLEGLSAGDHSIKFRAFDKNKNESQIMLYRWSVHLTAPTITFTESPNVMSHLAQFSSSGNKMIVKFATSGQSRVVTTCKANGFDISCEGNEISIDASEGYHSVAINSQDEAGNIATVTRSWQVTKEAGQVLAPKFLSQPSTYTNSTSIVVRIQAPRLAEMPAGSFIRCKIDIRDEEPCEPNKDLIYHDLGELKSGSTLMPHTFTVRLKFGTATPVTSSFQWYTDTTLPSLQVLKSPSADIRTNIIPFHFRVSDNSGVSNLTMICLLDGAAVECPMNQEFSLTVNKSGSHELLVDVYDAAGNKLASPISIRWTNPSCRPDELNLRWPLAGREGQDWSVMNYVDQDPSAFVRDLGGLTGDNAKTFDGADFINIYLGDHKKVFVYNGATITGNHHSAAVRAMASGVIVDLRRESDDTSIAGKPTSCAGVRLNFIRIRHDNGFESEYRNLSKNSIPPSFQKNQRVQQGSIIGYVGSSGCLDYPRLGVGIKSCANTFMDLGTLNTTLDSGRFTYNTGRPLLMSLAVHQKPAGGSLTNAQLMSRTFDVTSSVRAKKNQMITLSYILTNIRKGTTKIEYAILPPGRTSVQDADFVRTFTVNTSTGFLRKDEFESDRFTSAGKWTIKIYEISNTANCGNSRDKDNNCGITSIDVFVKD